jgi:hypothetical protein
VHFQPEIEKNDTKENLEQNSLLWLDDFEMVDIGKIELDDVDDKAGTGTFPDLKSPHNHEPLIFFNHGAMIQDDLIHGETKPTFASLFDVDTPPMTADGVKVEPLPQVFSDCMWSADFRNTNLNRDRQRDVSITLSECAEGLATITSMEMFEFQCKASPGVTFDNAGLMMNSLNDESDEEIDVVTANDSDVSLQQCHQNSFHRIEPGVYATKLIASL